MGNINLAENNAPQRQPKLLIRKYVEYQDINEQETQWTKIILKNFEAH